MGEPPQTPGLVLVPVRPTRRIAGLSRGRSRWFQGPPGCAGARAVPEWVSQGLFGPRAVWPTRVSGPRTTPRGRPLSVAAAWWLVFQEDSRKQRTVRHPPHRAFVPVLGFSGGGGRGGASAGGTPVSPHSRLFLGELANLGGEQLSGHRGQSGGTLGSGRGPTPAGGGRGACKVGTPESDFNRQVLGRKDALFGVQAHAAW